MLCDHLEGWEGDTRGRGYGDICIHIADSLCYTAETNNIVKQLYSSKDVKKMYILLFKHLKWTEMINIFMLGNIV